MVAVEPVELMLQYENVPFSSAVWSGLPAELLQLGGVLLLEQGQRVPGLEIPAVANVVVCLLDIGLHFADPNVHGG